MTATPYAIYALNIPAHNHWGQSWTGTGTGLVLSGGSVGLYGSGSIYGVYGQAVGSGTNYGVYGQNGSSSTGATGVYGENSASTGATYGVRGQSNSSSTGAAGVYGYTPLGSGTIYGVYGKSNSSGGSGVYGEGNWGLYGKSSTTSGRGVFGEVNAANGTNSGVWGQSASPDGRGVYGVATNTTGATYGVKGASSSPDGTGVYGSNSNSNGWAGGFSGKVRVAENLGVGTFTPFPPTYPGGAPLLHVMVDSPKATVATNRAFAVTTNDATNPFGLDIRLTGAAALANRAVFMQTTDFNSAGGGNIVLQPQGGNVGIGTATPTKAKLEVNGFVNTDYNIGGYLNRNGAGDFANTDTNSALSIWAQYDVLGRVFLAVSDARIKNIQGRSDGAADLATLNRIEITNYTLKDVITSGSAPVKKVIGQQVEAVYPQAVTRGINVVPDIYQQAPIKDGWVELATDLQKGERVRLIGEQSESVYEVLEVTPDGFRTDFAADGEAVFVYGREVDDFRSVDYEAIAMLDVSATQELNRLVEQQAAEIETLNTRLTALEQSGNAAANSPISPWWLLGGLGVVGLVVVQKRRAG